MLSHRVKLWREELMNMIASGITAAIEAMVRPEARL